MGLLVEFLVVAVPLIGVVVAIYISFRRFMRRQAERDAMLHAVPVTPIKNLVPGARVRIVGIATGPHVVASPYSKTPCLAFDCSSHAEIVTSGSTDGSMDFRQNFDAPKEREIRPFSVDDGTGKIGVVVDHVSLELVSHLLSPQDNHAFGAKMIARETTSSSYYEARLEPDSKVAVIGTVLKAEDGTLRIAGLPAAPAVVSNRSAALES